MMELPDDIRTRLRKRGHKSDWVRIGTRLSRDSSEALIEVCFREKWNIENVLDYLVEGFIANYRTFWPEEGMFQTQLTAFSQKESDVPCSNEISAVSHKTTPNGVKEHPDYYVRAMPLLTKLKGLAKQHQWSPDIEKELRTIAAETTDDWTRKNVLGVIQLCQVHYQKQPQTKME